MNNELLAMLDCIEQERGISKEQVVKALEQAILSAYRKSIRPASDLVVNLNPRTGELIHLTTELPEYFTSILRELGTPL